LISSSVVTPATAAATAASRNDWKPTSRAAALMRVSEARSASRSRSVSVSSSVSAIALRPL
jgi:hypothetical protein